jgi:hypothetical protein
MNMGDTGRSGCWNDVPEVEGLAVGVSDGHVHHFAHVVLEEEAAILVVVDQVICKNRIELI